ncbi:MAG: hypothetical protein IOD15_08015 [Phycisphaerales bacterium]|nr:hypothetical protein [Phycisphaerales bacterium]
MLRLGEILVKRGVMTTEQVERVLIAQRSRRETFGILAEELFGIDPRVLEEAWAEQYELVTAKVDPRTERTDPTVLKTLSRRQAWQFRMIPLRYDGREVMICTSREHLPRALRFAYKHYGPSCYFVLSEPELLIDGLQLLYPLPGGADQASLMLAEPA